MKSVYLLIILCILISLFGWVYQPFSHDLLTYSGNKLTEGAFWTPLTTLFVHFDWTHLIGNMIFLYVFGKAVEEEAGAKITSTAFFVGGIVSLLVSTFYYGMDVTMIGASGAIFTLAAAAMLIKPLQSSLFFFFIPLGLVAVLYFIFNVFAILLAFGGNVGYVAHVAGFVMGIPFGIACSKGKWLKNLAITIILLFVFLAIIYILQSFSKLL